MRTFRSALVALMAAGATACSEGATAPTGTASVQVIYTSATAGAASLRIGNATVTRPLTLNDVSASSIVQVEPGVQQFRIYGGADTTGALRANLSLTIRENERYTIIVRGNLPAAPAAQTLATTVLQNLNFALPISLGQPGTTGATAPTALPANAAGVRIVHAAPNANGAGVSANVWAWLYPSASVRPVAATAANVGQGTASDFIYVDGSAPQRLDIGSSAAPAVVRGSVASLTLAAGQLRTVVVVDGTTAGTVNFLVLNDNGPP